MIVLGVDPGQRTGLALVVDGVPACVDVVPGHVAPRRALAMAGHPIAGPVRVVIERPRIHAVGRLKGDPNQLLDLSVLVGRIAGTVETLAHVTAELVSPADWKGSIPKSIHQARTAAALHAMPTRTRAECLEREAWLAAWDRVDHNGKDALSLARWALAAEAARG